MQNINGFYPSSGSCNTLVNSPTHLYFCLQFLTLRKSHNQDRKWKKSISNCHIGVSPAINSHSALFRSICTNPPTSDIKHIVSHLCANTHRLLFSFLISSVSGIPHNKSNTTWLVTALKWDFWISLNVSHFKRSWLKSLWTFFQRM